jgi:hypothetical protein
MTICPARSQIRTQFIRLFEGSNHRIKGHRKSTLLRQCVHHKINGGTDSTHGIPAGAAPKQQQKESGKLDGQLKNDSMHNPGAEMACEKLTEDSNASMHVRASPCESKHVPPKEYAGNNSVRGVFFKRDP